MTSQPRFPIYVPSKSRADTALTPAALAAMGVPFRIVVEPQQFDDYAERFGAERLLVLDMAYRDDYDACMHLPEGASKGSGPARNFIWNHAASEGHAWHWVVDDNINFFARLHENRRIPMGDGLVFRAMEDFVLRYRNIAMAGPDYWTFTKSRYGWLPFTLNTRVFSCILIRNDLPMRWRARYNEDLDLSIRVLKAGWCTVLFKAFLHVPTEGHQAIVRDDTWDVLATPTDTFKLIYHSQMGELIDAYSEAWRKAGAEIKFETAGSVRGGAMVWALVYLDEPYTVPGDESPTYPFAALLNAHDGSAACKLLPTQVRIVCWNTWKMAEAEGNRHGHQVVLRHAGNVAERVEQAKAGLASMRDEAKEWQVAAADLAGLNFTDAMFATFLDEFIPVPENASERTRNQRAERRALFTKLYLESPTQDGIRGTAYGAVQAAGEYLDHFRPFRNSDTYLARTLFSPEPVKGGVVKLARQLATVG